MPTVQVRKSVTFVFNANKCLGITHMPLKYSAVPFLCAACQVSFKINNAQLRQFNDLEQIMYQMAQNRDFVVVKREGENSLMSLVFNILDFEPQVTFSFIKCNRWRSFTSAGGLLQTAGGFL